MLLVREITLIFSKVPRQDCEKVAENVCKPETRVKVVEVEEEVCEEEEVVTHPFFNLLKKNLFYLERFV